MRKNRIALSALASACALTFFMAAISRAVRTPSRVEAKLTISAKLLQLAEVVDTEKQ